MGDRWVVQRQGVLQRDTGDLRVARVHEVRSGEAGPRLGPEAQALVRVQGVRVPAPDQADRQDGADQQDGVLHERAVVRPHRVAVLRHTEIVLREGIGEFVGLLRLGKTFRVRIARDRPADQPVLGHLFADSAAIPIVRSIRAGRSPFAVRRTFPALHLSFRGLRSMVVPIAMAGQVKLQTT